MSIRWTKDVIRFLTIHFYSLKLYLTKNFFSEKKRQGINSNIHYSMLLRLISIINLLSLVAAQNSTSCIQSWQSRGPNNIEPASPMQAIGNGAISATFMPKNSTTLFLGSVNGGVWKTTNFFATPAPHYIPTTDMNLCQSVGTLAGSLTDPNFIAYGQ